MARWAAAVLMGALLIIFSECRERRLNYVGYQHEQIYEAESHLRTDLKVPCEAKLSRVVGLGSMTEKNYLLLYDKLLSSITSGLDIVYDIERKTRPWGLFEGCDLWNEESTSPILGLTKLNANSTLVQVYKGSLYLLERLYFVVHDRKNTPPGHCPVEVMPNFLEEVERLYQEVKRLLCDTRSASPEHLTTEFESELGIRIEQTKEILRSKVGVELVPLLQPNHRSHCSELENRECFELLGAKAMLRDFRGKFYELKEDSGLTLKVVFENENEIYY